MKYEIEIPPEASKNGNQRPNGREDKSVRKIWGKIVFPSPGEPVYQCVGGSMCHDIRV